MELPRALMPWAEWLDLFPTELIASIGDLVRRLDLALGPLRTPTRPGQDEPDGFDGIARRGDYERLLLSEWLLADEAPDEFLRRAAMNEHAFLEPARVAPAGARCSVALFDAGPNQLGAPRLAHLAALIVLARRAQAAGAHFHWGMLQEEAGSLRSEVTRGSLAHLLKARSLREASDEDVAAWRAQANSLVGLEDCWLIGGKRLQSLPAAQGARLLQLSEPLDCETRHLNARITQTRLPLSLNGAKALGEDCLQLPLPSADVCVHLLREPFPNRTTELRRVKSGRRPISNLVYISEHRIAARTAPNQIVVFSPPATPTGNLAKPKLYASPGGGRILAVGKAGKGFALITTMENASSLRIVRVASQSGNALMGTFDWPLPQILPEATHNALSCGYFMQDKQDKAGEGYWNLTLNHVQIQVSKGETPDHLSARAVRPHLAFDPVLYGSNLVGLDMVGTRMALQLLPPIPLGVLDVNGKTYGEFPSVRAAHFGYGGSLTHPDYGMWALEIAPGEWKILHRDANHDANYRDVQTDVTVETGNSVAGVVALPGIETYGFGSAKYAPALVVLDSTRRILTLRGNGWQRTEPPTATPIEHITVSPYEPNVAYTTLQGEVVVYSLIRQTALYRLDTEKRL